MSKRINLFKVPGVFWLTFCLLSPLFAQAGQKSPQSEKLLNGLKILMWSDPSAPKISVKLRIHSGSAFDPQGKEGTMKILAESIFPNEASRDFFKEDLGGSLDVESNYDYIQINSTASPENLATLLETLARAVTAPSIDKETTAKLKTAETAKVNEAEKNSGYFADNLAARRLFGTFPYGRPILGTSESVGKIDFADLILAKQRFLTADNATIAVSGNFKTDFAYRALRRFFGTWNKADKITPSAFRQPDDPDTKVLMVSSPVGGSSQARFLLRGWARNDKNFASSEILTEVLKERLETVFKPEQSNDLQIRQESHILPGVIVLSQNSVESAANMKNPLLIDNAVETLLAKGISNDEFTKAKAAAAMVSANKNLSDWWLDLDTYKLISVADEAQSFQNASLADVENTRLKLAKQPVVVVKIAGSEAARQSPPN